MEMTIVQIAMAHLEISKNIVGALGESSIHVAEFAGVHPNTSGRWKVNGKFYYLLRESAVERILDNILIDYPDEVAKKLDITLSVAELLCTVEHVHLVYEFLTDKFGSTKDFIGSLFTLAGEANIIKTSRHFYYKGEQYSVVAV